MFLRAKNQNEKPIEQRQAIQLPILVSTLLWFATTETRTMLRCVCNNKSTRFPTCKTIEYTNNGHIWLFQRRMPNRVHEREFCDFEVKPETEKRKKIVEWINKNKRVFFTHFVQQQMKYYNNRNVYADSRAAMTTFLCVMKTLMFLSSRSWITYNLVLPAKNIQ